MAVVPKTEREQLGLDPSPEEQEAAQLAADEAQQQQEQEAALQAEQENRPDWLPEKFKTPEDFVRSYSSLENELRERGTRERQQAERLAELEAWAQQSQEQPQAQADDPLAAYAYELEAAREQGDARREAELQAWLVQYNISQALQGFEQQSTQQTRPLLDHQNYLTAAEVKRSVKEQIPDFSDYEDRVGQLLQDEPWRMPREVLDDPALMQRALIATYDAVKHQDLVEQQRQLEEAGVTTADLQRARKMQAQTLSGATGRPGEPSEADRQIAEMRGALDKSSWEAHVTRPPQQ